MPNKLSSLIKNTIRTDVQSMHSYRIQSSDGMIKLDAMENPFRLPEHLRGELGHRLSEVAINRYPGSRIEDLRAALAAHTRLPSGRDLMLGNGSDELIQLLCLACARPGAALLAPEPGFVMYEVAARLQGLEFVGVPLTAEFELDAPAMLSAIEKYQPALIFLAYPNNPTANLFDETAIEKIVRAAPGFVIMDEAYQPFASKSYFGHLGKYDHLLIMRTLSKFGLAGVRLGYLMGHQAVIAEIDKVRPPYNVSVLNAEAALFALEHEEEFSRQARILRDERARLMTELSAMPAVRPYPSEGNMILVRVPNAGELFERLRQQKILIKNVSKAHPLLNNCVRLTVGTAEENDQLLKAFHVFFQTSV